MANIEHRDLGNTPTKMHGIAWQTVANAAALAALTIVAADISQVKVVRQLDTNQLWVPSAITPTYNEIFTSVSVITGTNLKGGYQDVATLAARNAIPSANREVGMTVYEVDTDQLWRLIGGTANANWVDVTITNVTNAVAGLVPAVGSVSTILQSTGVASNWVIPLTWDSTVVTPIIQQQTTGSATGQKLRIAGQQAATTGGGLEVASGVGGTTVGELSFLTGVTKVGSFQRSTANDFLAMGANPSTTAAFRASPGTVLAVRNNAFGLDIAAVTLGGTDILTFGSTNASAVKINAVDSGGIGLQTTGTDRISLTSFGINCFVAAWVVGAAAGASGYAESITNTNSGSSAAGFWRIRAMGTTSGNTNGAGVELEGGKLNGTGISGGVKLKLNQDDTQANMWIMFQVAHLASGANQRRVTALNFPGTSGAGITTTQVPANGGDLITFVGDAATIPSADEVGGHGYYSDGARPAWRFLGTNFRLNGTSNTANTTGGGLTLPLLAANYLDVQINGTQFKIPYYAA